MNPYYFAGSKGFFVEHANIPTGMEYIEFGRTSFEFIELAGEQGYKREKDTGGFQ